MKNLAGLSRKLCSRSSPKHEVSSRKDGISAIVMLRNEPFFEPSLLSIKDFVDEFIVVDCSTDDTQQRIRRLKKEHDLNLKYVHMGMDHYTQYKKGIDLSTYEWLLKWDGDFIAYHDRARNIRKLRKIIQRVPRERYCFIEFQVFNIDLDLLHTTRDPYHLEAYLYKFSPLLLKDTFFRRLRHAFRIVFGTEPVRSPHLPFPLWYDRITIPQPFVLHLRSVKSPLRLLEREYQTQWAWLSLDGKENYSNSFEQFFQNQLERDYNKDGEEITRQHISKLKRKMQLIPYSPKLHGDYPLPLKRMIRETIGMEIASTSEFRSGIMQFLVNS